MVADIQDAEESRALPRSAVARRLGLLDVPLRRAALAGRRLARRPDGLSAAARSALGRRGPQTGAGLPDLVVLGDVDAVPLRGAHDLPAGGFLRARRFELRLIPARHGVSDMRLVVD